MNKSVPTLLGIAIILLVVVLVVLVFNYKLTQELGKGGQVMGTTTTEALTGVELPEETIGAEEALGRREPASQAQPSPAITHPERVGERRAQAERRRTERMKAAEETKGTPPGGEQPESTGP